MMTGPWKTPAFRHVGLGRRLVALPMVGMLRHKSQRTRDGFVALRTLSNLRSGDAQKQQGQEKSTATDWAFREHLSRSSRNPGRYRHILAGSYGQ